MIELLHGFFILDKPFGWSSNRCLSMIKRALRNCPEKSRVGYIGTLDEGATGLLIVAVGRATKFIRFLEESNKQYRTKLLFGYTSDTNDIHGKVHAYHSVAGEESGVHRRGNERLPTVGQILSHLPNLTGSYEQLPPIYSAKRVNGQRSYKLARSGVQEIALKTKTVSLESIDIGGIKLSSGHYVRGEALTGKALRDVLCNERVREVELVLNGCSTGFYVRSFARDLGKALEVGALTLEIRRTLIDFNVCLETCRSILAKLNNYQNCKDSFLEPELLEVQEFAYNLEVADNIRDEAQVCGSDGGVRLGVEVKDGFVGIGGLDFQKLIAGVVKIDDFFGLTKEALDIVNR